MEWVYNISFLFTRPIVVTIYLIIEEVQPFESFLRNQTHSFICSDRIRILSYVAEKHSFFYVNFPINILRNIGIHHTLTTHFILFDIDMWASGMPFFFIFLFNRTFL